MGLTTKEIGSSSFNDMISSVDRRSEYVENRANANVTLNNFLTPYTLDNKSSILNAPCGYSNGTYASLRPVQTIGPELITNGDFATDTDWTKGTGWSIANGKASRTAQSGSTACDQSISLIAGKKYKIVYTLTISAGIFNVRFSGTTNVNGLSRTTSGTYVDYLVAATGNNTFRLVGADGSFVGSIDNVSVKEVTDADFDFSRGSSATRVNEKGLIEDVQILSSNLVQNGDFEQIGSELVTNGGFDDASGWSFYNADADTNTRLENNAAILEVINAQFTRFISTTSPMTIGNFYKVTYEVKETDNTDLAIQYPPTTLNSSLGTHSVYIKATNVNIGFAKSSVGKITIDNVSVKEVGQNWDFVGDTTVVDNGAKFDNTSVYSEIRQNNIMTPNSKIRLTITIEDYVGGGIAFPQFGVADGNGDPNFNISSNGTYVFESIFYSTHLTVKRTNTGTDLVVSNISVIEITDDTDIPRIDYTSGQGALLLEPQRTNLTQYSEAFDNAVWTKSNSTISPNQIISPDGTQNADKLITNNGLINGQVHYNISKSASQITYTSSIFVKKAEWDRIGLYITDASTFDNRGQAFFNLDGTLGTVASAGTFTNASSNIKEYPNDWYRVYLTVTVPSTTTTIVSRYYSLDNTELNGDGTSGIYIWGAQSEVGDYPTSIIKTEGATVTRSADVANNSGNADLFNDSEGVLYAEIAALADDLTFRSISISSDAGYNNSIMIRYISTSNQVNVITRIGGALNNTSVDVNDITEFNKIAFKYKSEDCALFINGVKAATSTQAFNSSGINNLSFDRGGGGSPFYGNTKELAVFKEALTDEELAQITSATQQEVFYQMRDRMNIKNYDYYEFGDYTTRLKKLF